MPNITNFPTGRVGIGTENPQQTLDVAGTLRVTGSTGTPSTLMGRNASGDVATVTVGSGLGINESNQLYATGGASGTTTGSGSTNQVAYWTGTNVLSGENNLWWDFSADRLGIGTNAPARSLDVIGGIRFSTVNGTPTTVVGVDASGDIGSVSIGTGLGLSGGVLSFTGSTGGSGTVTGTGTTNYLSKWASASGLTDSIVLETGSTIDINGSLRVRTSSGTATNVMGRDTNGYVSNIAIGNGLSVSGGTLSTTGVTFGTGADGRVAYWTGTGVTNQIGNDNNFIWDYESDRLGIGVFPTSALHISSADSASIRIVKTGTSPADFSLVALNGKLDIGSAFTITDTGRLGLGTNTPAQTLDVAGNMRLTGSTGTSATVMGRSVDGDISAISVGSGLSLSGNVLTTTGGTSGTVTGTGTVNYLSKWASSTGLTDSIVLETGNTIDIAGSLRVTTASGTATLIAGQDANGYFSRITVGSGLSLAGNTLTATGGGSGTVSGSGTATQVAFWDGITSLTGNTNLYWDNSNNRLGIGTSSPSNQLTTTSDASISTLTIGRGNNSIANNTAIGVNALANNAATLVSGNTAVGFQTITGNTFGGFNSAFGNLALSKTTTGNSNTAIGSDALTENTTGNSNTAAGRAALSNNTVGGSNVAIGASAFLNNISGSTSIAIGASAGNFNNENNPLTVANSSIFIGANTKASNISPSNQIVIGTSAIGLADNATVIGTTGTTQTHLYGNTTIGSNTTPIGRLTITGSGNTSASTSVSIQNSSLSNSFSILDNGSVGINYSAPTSLLDIRARQSFATVGTTELASSFASSVPGDWTGSGNTWTHVAGNTSTLTATVSNTSFYRVIITVGAGSGSLSFTLKGYSSAAITSTTTFDFPQVNGNNLVITPSSDLNRQITVSIVSITAMPPISRFINSADLSAVDIRTSGGGIPAISIGTSAGSYITSGSGGLYIGSGAGSSVTTGGGLAIGTSAASNNSRGTGWVAIGSNSAQNNSTGINWIAIGGDAALSNINGNSFVAIGTNCAKSGTNSGNYVAIGSTAAANGTTSSNYVAIGTSASNGNITGNNYVSIGTNAGRYISGGTTDATATNNSVYIGHTTKASSASPTNEIVIGYQAEGIGSNSTVIGNTSTTQTYLYGNLTLGLTSADTTARVKATSSDATSGSFAAKFQNNSGTDILSVRGDGVVGIGTTSPAQTLDIRGTMRLTGSTGTGTTLMGRDGSGDVSAISVGSGLSLSGNTLSTTGTTGVSGSGTATQVAFWGGTTTLSGSSNLYWDNTNGRLGIANSSPAARLYVKGSTSGNGSTAFEVTDNTDRDIINVRDDGRITLGRNLASNVQNSVTLEAAGTADNISIAIVPKGNGGITASIPDNSATGGGIRGWWSTDLQTQRGSSTQIASGNYSVINGGYANEASGNYSVINGGQNNTSSGAYSAINGGSQNISLGSTSAINGGEQNYASEQYTSINGGFSNYATATVSSVSGGIYGSSYLYGQNAISSGRFAALGDAQTSTIRLRRQFTGTATTELYLDGISLQAILQGTNRIWNVRVQSVAVVTVSGGTLVVGDTIAGEYGACIRRIGTTTTLISEQTKIFEHATGNMTSAVSITISADNGTEALKVTYQPPAAAGTGTTFRVVATVYITEVGF